jgi:hypothetical protein
MQEKGCVATGLSPESSAPVGCTAATFVSAPSIGPNALTIANTDCGRICKLIAVLLRLAGHRWVIALPNAVKAMVDGADMGIDAFNGDKPTFAVALASLETLSFRAGPPSGYANGVDTHGGSLESSR